MVIRLKLILFLIFFNITNGFSTVNYSTKDLCYFWFAASQTKEGLVLKEGNENISVYEQAISALVFLIRGHHNRAARIFRYFNALKTNCKDNFNGFLEYYYRNSRQLSQDILSSTQLWMLLAITEYCLKTKSKEFLPLARCLADKVLSLEGPEGGIACGFKDNKLITDIKSSDNILALLVFFRLWEITGDNIYRLSAIRTYKFLLKELLDKERKVFKKRAFCNQVDPDATLLAILSLYNNIDIDYKNILDGTDIYKKIMRYYISIVLEGNKDVNYINDIEKYLVYSKKYTKAIGFPRYIESKDIDITTTSLYLFLCEEYNPFNIRKDLIKDIDINTSISKELFKGDDFDSRYQNTILAYPLDLIEAEGCKVFIDIDSNKSDSNSGLFRILFLPEKVIGDVKGVITRRFLDFMDFSRFTSISVWIKSKPSQISMQYSLQFALGVVDRDNRLWISQFVNAVRSSGYVYNFSFPSGWKIASGNSKDDTILDTSRIKEFKFIFTQQDEIQWEIFLDNLVLK